MIPEFPDSRQITLDDKHLFDALFAAKPPEISAYTFTDIFAWREAHGTTVSRMGEHILVLSNINGETACLQPLGDGPIRPVVEEMLRRASQPIVFRRLPSEAVSEFENAGLVVETDRDNCDYVYRAEDLIDLAGRKYDAKRNFIARAKSQIDYEYVRINAAIALECEDFADLWCDQKLCDTVDGLRRERCAINQMLTNFTALGIVGGAIRANGAIVAFSLGEPLNPDTLVIHVEKADTRIDGLYQLINNEFCRGEAFARKPVESPQASPPMIPPYKCVNREQDLGIPGLRKAKESYHPVQMIETFRAR
jgi:hypothetical protein